MYTTASNIGVMNITEKAGMGGIDKEKINQIIHQASKGSLFYKKQAQRQSEIHKSIEKMLTRVKSATSTQVENAKITCDRLLEDLERKRVFTRIIVHFDLDMFFAAVEIRDNPDLADKPVAVGGDSMVSTSNYIARRFGVRAAMPGFIAKKLCPALVLIKPNGFKYRKASSEVFSILEQYDPELTSMSLDEAYVDLTEYVKNSLERDGEEVHEFYDGTLPQVWWTRAAQIVEEIRQAVYDKTKLTCSAGISCNTLLAKISTDINKPNGYFMVEGYPRTIKDFIVKTPVEKVSGIGKVSAQFLNALDIITCGDIYDKRHFLPLVFYEINVKFYLRTALGDGSVTVKSDEYRKSKSVERTFPAVKDSLILLDKLDNICEELCYKYLRPYRIRGRTVTVKLKRNTFTTTTKSYSMLVATNDKSVIYSAAKNLLLSEIASESPEISYRLLGVKLSNLADDGVTTNQLTIDAMLRNQGLVKSKKSDLNVHLLEFSEASSDHQIDISETESLRPDFTTQEDPIEIPTVVSDDTNHSKTNNDNIAKKRSQSQMNLIDKFLTKRVRISESSDGDQSRSQSPFQDAAQNLFLSQDDEMDSKTCPNKLVEQERRQNDSCSEEFQCPYCFKPFADFCKLEDHVSLCSFKTSLDPNGFFISQRPTSNPQTPISHPGTCSRLANRAPKSVKRASKIGFSQASALTKVTLSITPSTQDSSPRGLKTSFYQKFIESNSQSLSQSVKVEPYQCPHCLHGFLSFESLGNHVPLCNKQYKST